MAVLSGRLLINISRLGRGQMLSFYLEFLYQPFYVFSFFFSSFYGDGEAERGPSGEMTDEVRFADRQWLMKGLTESPSHRGTAEHSERFKLRADSAAAILGWAYVVSSNQNPSWYPKTIHPHVFTRHIWL